MRVLETTKDRMEKLKEASTQMTDTKMVSKDKHKEGNNQTKAKSGSYSLLPEIFKEFGKVSFVK